MNEDQELFEQKFQQAKQGFENCTRVREGQDLNDLQNQLMSELPFIIKGFSDKFKYCRGVDLNWFGKKVSGVECDQL